MFKMLKLLSSINVWRQVCSFLNAVIGLVFKNCFNSCSSQVLQIDLEDEIEVDFLVPGGPCQFLSRRRRIWLGLPLDKLRWCHPGPENWK